MNYLSPTLAFFLLKNIYISGQQFKEEKRRDLGKEAIQEIIRLILCWVKKDQISKLSENNKERWATQGKKLDICIECSCVCFIERLDMQAYSEIPWRRAKNNYTSVAK